MLIVAQHLESETRRRKDPAEIDLFGRSTFNRYYYATFWIVRECLKTLDASWTEPSHSQVPEILRGKVRKRISKQLRLNILSENESGRMRARAMSSISTLANLLEEAYLIRTKVDYKPEAIAKLNRGTIIMAGITSGEAARWPTKAQIHTANIIDVCKKLGVI